VACVLAGLAPGWHALRANLNPGSSRRGTGGHPRLGKALVVAQISISMVLVVGAALSPGRWRSCIAWIAVCDGCVLAFRLRTSGCMLPRGAGRRSACARPLNALPRSLAAQSALCQSAAAYGPAPSAWKAIRFVPTKARRRLSCHRAKYFATVGTRS